MHPHFLDRQACLTGACCAKQAGVHLFACSFAEYMAAGYDTTLCVAGMLSGIHHQGMAAK